MRIEPSNAWALPTQPVTEVGPDDKLVIVTTDDVTPDDAERISNGVADSGIVFVAADVVAAIFVVRSEAGAR